MVKKHKIMILWDIEGQNNESYRGFWTLKKSHFLKNSHPRGGGSGEVGMLYHSLPVFSFKSFPNKIWLINNCLSACYYYKVQTIPVYNFKLQITIVGMALSVSSDSF